MSLSHAPAPERDVSGSGYLWRLLTPSQASAIAKALDDGVHPSALAREYGVNVRTIYRAAARARTSTTVMVVVGDWQAEFAITELGPVRMTAWHAR